MAYDLQEQESIDELKAWWDKWGNLTLGAITVVCLAFAGYNGMKWYDRYKASEANKAYAWNYGKWALINMSDSILKSWSPVTQSEYRDFVATEVTTSTLMDGMINGPVRTLTSFEFRQINNTPCVIFRNETLDNTLAEGFVFNNEKQYQSEGMADRYSFLLVPEDVAEEV